MSRWRTALRGLLATVVLGASQAARAAITCSIVAAPSPFTGIYSSTANLDVLGSFTINCTRDPASDPRRPDIWIGIAQSVTGNTLPRDIGGGPTLSYVVYRRNFGTGVWTDTGAQRANQNGNAALGEAIDFGNGGSTYTGTYNVYARVPAGQATVPAGIYLNLAVPVTMRLTDQNGAILATTSLGFRYSIPKDCRFSTDPTPVSILYPAFSAAAVTGASNFTLTCTQGTTYTIALDLNRSLIPTVELAYNLSLSAASGTGTAVSQPYSVNISVDAGQAGKCAGSSCNGTDTRTITITY